VRVGDRILINDGLLELVALEVNDADARVKARVLNGGELNSHKGLNLPVSRFRLPLSPKKTKQTSFLR